MLASIRALLRGIRAARRVGQTPEAVIVSPEFHLQLQNAALSYLWSSPEREALFDVPVEVAPQAKEWSVRLRPGRESQS